MLDARRLFLANGILRKATMAGGWLPLSLRLVVDLDFTAFELLLMGTAIELAILLGEVPTGVVADVFSRKWSVVAGAFLLSCAQFASGIVEPGSRGRTRVCVCWASLWCLEVWRLRRSTASTCVGSKISACPPTRHRYSYLGQS